MKFPCWLCAWSCSPSAPAALSPQEPAVNLLPCAVNSNRILTFGVIDLALRGPSKRELFLEWIVLPFHLGISFTIWAVFWTQFFLGTPRFQPNFRSAFIQFKPIAQLWPHLDKGSLRCRHWWPARSTTAIISTWGALEAALETAVGPEHGSQCGSWCKQVGPYHSSSG